MRGALKAFGVLVVRHDSDHANIVENENLPTTE